MTRPFTPKLITANDLRDGRSVWLTELGGWSRTAGEALLLTTEDEAQHHLSIAEAQTGQVISVALIEAERSANGPAPRQTRERIRASGPFVDPYERAA
jgi:hypothetical protein